MPEQWPQVYRIKITFESLLKNCFVPQSSMKSFVNWILLDTHVRFEQTPTLTGLYTQKK